MTRTTTRATATKSAKAPAKTIAKSRAVRKTATKKTAAPKVTTSAKAKSAKERQSEADSAKQLDLCLLLDCTSSMSSWIERSKDTLKQIIDHVKEQNRGLTVRVCFVGYRDIRDTPRFTILPFTENINEVKSFIAKTNAQGGADMPEDVQGGFNKALQQDWGLHSAKQVFMICDAPGHGKDLTGNKGSFADDFPNGSPDGFKL